MAFPKPKPGQIKSFSPKGKVNSVDFDALLKFGYTEEGVRKFLQTAAFIEKNCTDFLTDVRATGAFLYHGYFEPPGKDFLLAAPSDNRLPRDTAREVSDLANTYLESAGFAATRKNSLFCTASFDAADTYTDSASGTYFIFPLNGFSYTWSMEQVDWTIDRADLSSYFIPVNQVISSGHSFLRQLGNPKYFKNLQCSQNDLEDLTEISQFWSESLHFGSGKGYLYDLNENYRLLKIFDKVADRNPEIRKILSKETVRHTLVLIRAMLDTKKAAKAFVKDHKIISTRLDTAMKVQHEILISGRYVGIGTEYSTACYNYFREKV